MRDADLFHFDADTSWEAEDAAIRAGAHLFAGLPVPVETFRNTREAIYAFAAVCCSVGLTVGEDGDPRVYAPYGYDDLFGLVLRPNPHSPAPRHVYESKAERWVEHWPQLTVLPWDGAARPAS